MTHVGSGRRLIVIGGVLIVGALAPSPPTGFTELAASLGLLLAICGGFLCVYRFPGGPPRRGGGGFWGGGPPSGGGHHHHGGGFGGHGGGGH